MRSACVWQDSIKPLGLKSSFRVGQNLRSVRWIVCFSGWMYIDPLMILIAPNALFGDQNHELSG